MKEKLFLVEKQDAVGKHDAKYIVLAATESEALEKVNLSPDAIQEMNEPYINAPYPRYKVTVEEVEFNPHGFYVLDC